MEDYKFEVVEHTTETKVKNGKTVYYYYSIIRCKECGYVKKIYKNDFRHMSNCKMCNLKKYKLEFEGFENKMYTVLEFSHQVEKRLYYKVLCRRCNSEIVMRKDAILNDANCSCIKCKSNGITPSMKAPLNVYQYYYMIGARQRNLEWSLSQEEFRQVISQACAYCGELPRPIQSLKRYTRIKDEVNVNGIDRIDSTKGYTLDNVTACCKMCNRFKSNHNVDNFLSHVSKIYKNSIESSTTIPNGSTSQANGEGNGENPFIS